MGDEHAPGRQGSWSIPGRLPRPPLQAGMVTAGVLGSVVAAASAGDTVSHMCDHTGSQHPPEAPPGPCASEATQMSPLGASLGVLGHLETAPLSPGPTALPAWRARGWPPRASGTWQNVISEGHRRQPRGHVRGWPLGPCRTGSQSTVETADRQGLESPLGHLPPAPAAPASGSSQTPPCLQPSPGSPGSSRDAPVFHTDRPETVPDPGLELGL